MNTKILGAFLLMSMLSGCIIVADNNPPPPPPAPGDVTFTWSFTGKGCADFPDIQSVRVEIPGEALQNDGVFPCSANDYPGIVLHDFRAGSYTYALDALGYDGKVLFIAEGEFTVNGDTRVTVDLTPAGGPTSYAYLSWTFPPNSVSQNPTCAEAGIAFVDVSVDGAAFLRHNCEDGQLTPGVVTDYLVPGSHSITLIAVDSNNYDYFRYDGQFSTIAGSPVSQTFGLDWAVGGAAISWQISNGSVGETCGQSGIVDVYINFMDENGDFVYPGAGDPHGCNDAPVIYSFLKPGNYFVYAQGQGTAGNYSSDQQNPPLITVTAGEFPDGSSPLIVQISR